MNEALSRALLYGGAVLVLAGIGVAWSNTSTDADVMTMLSSADVQLRLAHGIPEVDNQGQLLTERDAMITSAIGYLEKVEQLQPGMAVTAEFRGFAHMLRGRFADAAQCYRTAQACSDCGEEQTDVLAFNEARMLAQAGLRERALSVFQAHATALDERYGHQRLLEEAAILRELGRRADCKQHLDRVVRDEKAGAMAWLQAGIEYARLGNLDSAAHALERARQEVPIADYHLAQVKLQQGEVDTSFELLGRAAKARPAEVRQMLLKEAEAWSAVAMDVRFQELSVSQPASPGR